jgi:hypothetical protein
MTGFSDAPDAPEAPFAHDRAPEAFTRPLSPDPLYDQALSQLLSRSVRPLLDAAVSLRPRALLLMGSAACGEAVGVRLPEGGWLALSDLDLGLFVERTASAIERERLRASLEEALAPVLRELGLGASPVDAGIYTLSRLREIPRMLELAEIETQTVPLWGDRGEIGKRLGPLDRAFEVQRLVLNRVAEAIASPDGLALAAPLCPVWREAPGQQDWRTAHRWSKLPLDLVSAIGVLRGVHAPSCAQRLAWLEREAASGTGDLGDIGAPDLLVQVRDWTAWRLQPAWPPPRIDPRAIAAGITALLEEAGRAHGSGPLIPASRPSWLRELAREGGSGRERVRRWRRMLAHRPPGVSLARALRFAWRWGRVWPATLATCAAACAWVAAANGDPHAKELRALLAREVPVCQDLSHESWDGAWSRALQRLLVWVREAGG